MEKKKEWSSEQNPLFSHKEIVDNQMPKLKLAAGQ